jgi:hypothetical protein
LDLFHDTVAGLQDLRAGIFFISVESGERHESKIELPASFVAAPSFSPDGKYLAFISGPGFLSCEVYVVPVSGGKPRALTSVHADLNGVAWAPDGPGRLRFKPSGTVNPGESSAGGWDSGAGFSCCQSRGSAYRLAARKPARVPTLCSGYEYLEGAGLARRSRPTS